MGCNSARPEGYEPNQMKRPLIRQANGNSEQPQFLSQDGRRPLGSFFFIIWKPSGQIPRRMHQDDVRMSEHSLTKLADL